MGVGAIRSIRRPMTAAPFIRPASAVVTPKWRTQVERTGVGNGAYGGTADRSNGGTRCGGAGHRTDNRASACTQHTAGNSTIRRIGSATGKK